MQKKSNNPITKEKISNPNTSDNNLKKFVDNHKNKKIVVVQGLGFVGAVMSLVVCNSKKNEYAVIGIDLKSNQKIIDSINCGIFPIESSDQKIQNYFNNAIKKKNFFATHDTSAYRFADIIIVDINLDVMKKSDFDRNLDSYNVDLNPFKSAIRTIGNNCKQDVLILVETTVPPGTCLKVVKPIINEELSKRKLPTENVKIGHSYERVMPGPDYIDSIKNFYRVFSGIDKKSADETESFLRSIISTKKYPLTRLVNTNATEMAKVLENSYRAMNIAFIVEWSRFAEEANVNLYEIIDAIRMRPTHSNLMYPGIGVGGYCLTKDPLLASWSRKNHFGSNSILEQSEQGVRINDKMPIYAFDFMKRAFKIDSLNKKNILLLGVSYRSDVGDTRYSPVEFFYLKCFNEGANIETNDPYVKYWEEIDIDVSQDLDSQLNKEWDIIVFSTGHKQYNTEKYINKLSKMKNVMFYDPLGFLSTKSISLLKNDNELKVLGRGDI